MPDVTWIHPGIPIVLEAIPKEVKSLIDVGCGRGIIGALCRIYRDPLRLVGIDVYKPYLEFCNIFKFYDELMQLDLENSPLPFNDKEFEVATCIEVIEHLSRPAGERLLDDMERVAGRVIVTTPNRFFEQPEYDGNPYQKHLSIWRTKDFLERGYRVYGVGDMKICGRTVKYISGALGPLTRYMPKLSSLLLCVKNVG